MLSRKTLQNDRGFTLLEVIVVMVLVAILASIFSETINSSMQIYADQTQRKDTHSDVRRAYDFMAHSLREWTDFPVAPTATQLDFRRYSRFQDNSSNIYYAPLREKYSVAAQILNYQRDDGEWAALYPLIGGGINPATTLFTTSTLGTKQRIIFNLNMTQNGKPFKMLMTIFPRSQGG